jgi:tetratricopeptide (TPR) repeat protein
MKQRARLLPDAAREGIERPDAPPEYDVLVGNLAALEGRIADARDAFTRAATKDPDSAYLQRSLGRFSAQLDDLDQALIHGQRAVELDPEDDEARLFLGRLYRIRRDAAGAEGVLLDENGQPVSDQAALLLYQVYLERNRLPEALTVAQDLVASDPGSLGGYMALATAHERMGRPAEAESALRRALEHHPGRFVLYSRMARMRRAAGDREGEIAIYREVLLSHPKHYGTMVSLAEALIATEDLEGAIQTYEEIVAQYPDDQQSIRRLSSLEFSAGQHQRAAERLERALERSPHHLSLAYTLGQVWRGAGDPESALAAFQRLPVGHANYADARLQILEILEQRGDHEAALEEAERIRTIKPSRALDFHTATLRWRAGDFEGGVELLGSLLAVNPDDDEVLYQLGVLHGMAKRVDEALGYMEAALEKNPENAHALNYIGYTWAERGENLDQAESMILQALQLRPDDGYITDSLGWVYYMRARPLLGAGRVDDALALLEQAREKLSLAAELTGGDPVVSEHLGDVHMLMDQKERALKFYEEALSLEPRTEEQPQLMDKLEELRRELGTR